ncbi:MAG: hypothetical protein LBI60_06065 [Bacteroidales bacterium]|nr:hypothetical protein [Bacteroidales bacterium]
MKRKETENSRGKSYLLKIEGDYHWGKSPYFLFIWVDETALMEDIDLFLRKIWLKSCDSLSAFSYPQSTQKIDYSQSALAKTLFSGNAPIEDNPIDKSSREIPMDKEVNTVFHKNLNLEYEYDFGNSTRLMLKVTEEYPFKITEKIILLSRNEPLKFLCHSCKTKPATQVSPRNELRKEYMFCDECIKKYQKESGDFEDCLLPIVNSPRMGVCGYKGGTIDTERD